MSEAGIGTAASIGVLVIEDKDGDYGVASASLEGDAAAVAETTIERALVAAGCPGELPELVWIYQAPGREEEVLRGLKEVVGDHCPIIGGSSADDAVAGNWRQIGPDGVLTDGLVVAVLFPSGGVSFAFQGGYEPSGRSGVATRIARGADVEGGFVDAAEGRYLLEIDGRAGVPRL